MAGLPSGQTCFAASAGKLISLHRRRGLVVKLAYHASLSRRRSPVRIRSGPPVKVPQLVWGIFTGWSGGLNWRCRFAVGGDANRRFGGARPRAEACFEHGRSGKGRSPLSGRDLIVCVSCTNDGSLVSTERVHRTLLGRARQARSTGIAFAGKEGSSPRSKGVPELFG